MKIVNKRAKFDYKIIDKFEAGIVLTGSEVKAVKKGRVDISHSYAKIINNEAYLINTTIETETGKDSKQNRTRKLLLHKDQIISIKSKIKGKALTLIPARMYNKGRLIKLELALAKTKKKYEKRESMKKAELERQIERELKDYK
jgi:SsrA-binding protein